MFRPSYLMNISRVSEDGLFHSLLSVISRAIHHTGWNIIKRKLFWTRLHSYPLCGVWESNRRIQHFNQVWYESFPWSFYQDSSWISCPDSSSQQNLNYPPLPLMYSQVTGAVHPSSNQWLGWVLDVGSWVVLFIRSLNTTFSAKTIKYAWLQ